MVVHVMACDVRVIRKTNCTSTWDSSQKSASIAKLIISTVSWEGHNGFSANLQMASELVVLTHSEGPF